MSRSQKNAAVINAKTAAAQEIGSLPAPLNPQRRARAAADNLYFAETYFPNTFFMGWAPYQRRMMDRFQAIAIGGGKECHAVKRGGLKSTCARVSTVWAVLNGHRRFVVLVGATDDKAKEHRKNFFDMLKASPLLLEDYPEIRPLLLKEQQPKKQFRLEGRLLRVFAKDDKGRIVFPDIEGVPSDQAHIAPYSVDATDVSGLSIVDRHGVTVRPDLLVFDDVQTPQSAASPKLTDKRESTIVKVFGGLEGMTEKIPAIMVCTVREHDCLTMRFLNRERHPDWDGYRYPSIIKMPENMDLWDTYGQKLTLGRTADEGMRMATDFYLLNRDAMRQGAEVAWEKDITEPAIDALQSLMTERAVRPDYFRTDIQQEGAAPANTSSVKLDAQQLITRLNGVKRGIVPAHASFLTAFIDSSDEVLWWMVMAWRPDFSGAIVDYGTWPDQQRPMFLKRDLAHTISQQLPDKSWEEAFVHSHNELEEFLLERDWITEDGDRRRIDRCLKDWSDGQHKPRVTSQVMSSPNRAILRPSKGAAPKPGRKPVHLWGDENRDRHTQSHWVERLTETPVHVQFDSNIWKTHAARRLLTTRGAASAVLLPGDDEYSHRKLVEHLTAENPVEQTYDGSSGTIWEQPPGIENDWWDCFVGNNVAASMLGCTLKGEKVARKPPPRTFSLPGR